MAFYFPDETMHAQLGNLLDRLENRGRPGLHETISITWVRYKSTTPAPNSGYGASWASKKPLYPASVVKMIYAVATEAWIQKDLIPESIEMRRALASMIKNSSNDATGFIVDLLTGTTSGPSLAGEGWNNWRLQRQLINQWVSSLGWPELKESNCCQKTWEDSPYGRDSDFYQENNSNRNTLTTSGTARFLEAIMTNGFLSPNACKRTRELLSRSIDPLQRQDDLNNQIDGFIGAGLPQGSQLWSKAGLMSTARHDAAWFSIPGGDPTLLVIFSVGRERSKDTSLLPEIASELIKDQ
ncbi:serine hydrolase [Prochlorococcus sp. MIT 1341]|uniref:serine hydrolase n=1 Tax=Prochlorococcus sp. MIT 1341 TaxID=3096221 RepID=UPI002A75A283|nr:serine hydrolase [Prochlorococcus sp. MIT 1341]